VYALTKSGGYYFWGLNHSGLALTTSRTVNDTPIPLDSLSTYAFTDLLTSSDHSLAIGSSVLLTFNYPDHKDLQPFTMHAYHVHDETLSREDLMKVIGSI
jgi:hypothetical protein